MQINDLERNDSTMSFFRILGPVELIINLFFSGTQEMIFMRRS